MTGSFNKIIVAVAGIVGFQEPTSARNLLSIALGLAAGALFGFAKQAAQK